MHDDVTSRSMYEDMQGDGATVGCKGVRVESGDRIAAS